MFFSDDQVFIQDRQCCLPLLAIWIWIWTMRLVNNFTAIFIHLNPALTFFKEPIKTETNDPFLYRQDEELKRKFHELHQDNSVIKKTLRQRDKNTTLELQNLVRNSFRQMDFTSKLKNTVKKEMEVQAVTSPFVSQGRTWSALSCIHFMLELSWIDT